MILKDLDIVRSSKMKYILNMTNDEIKKEIRDILKQPDLEPQDRAHIGFIADTKSEYMHDGKINEKQLHELYNKGKYIDSYIMTLAINSLRNRKADLFTLIKDQGHGKKVLDFGCGPGTHGIACAQNGAEVFLFDISKKMLDTASKRFSLRKLQAWVIIDRKVIRDNTFDTILCTDVLEHVLDPLAIIKDFVRWLKIGGVAHIHVSHGKSYERGHLPESIDKWHTECVLYINKHFKPMSDNNYKLIKK